MISKKNILGLIMLVALFIFACTPALHDFSELGEDVIDEEIYEQIYEELSRLEFEITYTKVGEGTIYPEGKRPFNINDIMNLNAEPAQGWHFIGWFLYIEQDIIDVSEEIAYIISEEGIRALINQEYDHLIFLNEITDILEHIQINLDGEINPQLVAVFLEFDVPTTNFNITYTKIGEGYIYPEGKRPFDPNDLLELEAQPAEGWTFLGWFLHLEPQGSEVIVIDDLEKIIEEDIEGLIQGNYENTYFLNDEYKILEYSRFFLDQKYEIYLVAYFIDTNNTLPDIHAVEFKVIDETKSYEFLTVRLKDIGEASAPLIKVSDTDWYLIRLLKPGTYDWVLSGRKILFSDENISVINDELNFEIHEDGTITGNTSYTIKKQDVIIQENFLVEIIKRGNGEVMPDEGIDEYAPNHTLYLNAQPEEGWQLDGWFVYDMDNLSEEVYSTQNESFYLVINNNFVIIAEFIEHTQDETTTTTTRRSRRSTPYTYDFSYGIPGEGERAPLIQITFPEPITTIPQIESEIEPEPIVEPTPQPQPEPEPEPEPETTQERSSNLHWIIAGAIGLIALGVLIFLHVRK